MTIAVEAAPPVVSVIVPVFNTQDYLRKCFSSILDQGYGPVELIVIDDGSTDGSLEICREFAAADSRVRVISKPNEGQGVARNLGLDMARGAFVMFVDSDDYMLDDAFVTLIPRMIETGADILSFHVEFVDLEDRVTSRIGRYSRDVIRGEDIFRSSLLDQDVYSAPWNKVYRRDLIERHAIRFPHIRAYEDSFFSRSVARAARLAIFDDRTFYRALKRPDSTTRALTSTKVAYARDLFAHESAAFSAELQNPEVAIIFDAHVVKFLAFLLVLSAFRIQDEDEYRRAHEIAESCGFSRIRRSRPATSRLSVKVRGAVWLAGHPGLLRLAARVARRLGLTPY